MPVERTTAYTTSDGRLFPDEVDARNHQARIDLQAEYRNRVLYGNYAGSYVQFDDLITWLRENKSYARDLIRQFT